MAALAAVTVLVLALASPAAAQTSSAQAEASAATALSARAGLGLRGVRAVQRRLAQLGYLPLRGVDGIYGVQTRGAVVAFQKWELLPRDGIAGPVTRGVLAHARRPAPFTRARGTWVEILLDRQVLLLVRDGWVARISHVSTGRRGFVTPPGDYIVQRKKRRAWSTDYKVWLPWASYFVRGIAVHQSRSVPVRPASHGCVRVSRYEAEWLFRRMPVGMPVRVLART